MLQSPSSTSFLPWSALLAVAFPLQWIRPLSRMKLRPCQSSPPVVMTTSSQSPTHAVGPHKWRVTAGIGVPVA